MTRCLLVSTLTVFILVVGCAGTQRVDRESTGPSSGPKPEPPNIVLIVADDLGYGDLGCYGQARIRTPQIDRLAREGIRFTQHYAGSTVCAPSRCSLFTGYHTGHAWIRGNSEVRPMGQRPLREEDVTIAELLSTAGYTTGLFGKWGLGGPASTGEPRRQGFDEFYGYLCQRHAHNYYPEFLFDNETKVPLSNVVRERRSDGAGVAHQKKQYAHDLIADRAVSFIDRHHDRPFFLCATFTIPHANNEAGKHGMEVPSLGEYAETDWPVPQKGHAAMISRMDRDVGRLVAKLEEHGVADNTLVLFTSDNGPHREGGNDPHFNDSNGPLRGIKRSLYEGGIRVPLIAWWPGTIAPAESDHVSAGWDYLPTFCELARVDAPTSIDGVSFVPTLRGKADEQRSHDSLYWEFHEGKHSKQALRVGRWKYVRHRPDGPIQLFDLEADPGETTDRSNDHPEEVEDARRLFLTARSESPHWRLDR